MENYKLYKLQNVLLEIVKDIDKLCIENNIEYYLFGGTALGAKRHEGFIPWDDDFDIVMTYNNYDKFIQICRKHLDQKKYYLQEGGKDWPLFFSKLRLRGTTFEELDPTNTDPSLRGIYIDIFRFDNISDNKLVRIWQYICSKILITHTLQKKGYTSAPLYKKILMFLSTFFDTPKITNFLYNQVTYFNNKSTKDVATFFGITRYKNFIISKNILGEPNRVKFGNLYLPVFENNEEYLQITYGDYMKFPHPSKRKPLHMISIDFGIYGDE